jgi:WD40 repeat protein
MNIFETIQRIFRGKKQSNIDKIEILDTAWINPENFILRDDLRRAITCEGRALRLWELDSDKSQLSAAMEVEYPIMFAATDNFSEEWVAFCSTGAELSSPCFLEFRSWKTLSVQRTISMPCGLVWPQSLAISQDGGLIAVSSYEEKLLLYDHSSGELVAQSERENACISGVSFSPDSKFLAAGYTDQGGGDILIFDVSQKRLDVVQESLPRGDLSKFDLADSSIATAFSPNGGYIVTHETWPWPIDECLQGAVAVYRMPEAKLEWVKLLASDDVAKLYQKLGNVLCCFDAHPRFSVDSQTLFVGTAAGNVIAFSVANGAELARIKVLEDGFVRRIEVDNIAKRFWSMSKAGPVSAALT